MATGAVTDLSGALDALEGRLDALYVVHDTYFTADPALKQERLRGMIEALRAALATLGGALAAAPASLRARAAFIGGKAMDAVEGPSAEAEEELSRAVKLDPMLVPAWAALGHAFWKKKDYATAYSVRACGWIMHVSYTCVRACVERGLVRGRVRMREVGACVCVLRGVGRGRRRARAGAGVGGEARPEQGRAAHALHDLAADARVRGAPDTRARAPCTGRPVRHIMHCVCVT